ncbi:LuxR C-terminal-related transcriptional regulator [Cupriavidus sp. 2MCAB6]|uniref:LuxR C-terminal-related transcriptional regulator n=1 Tax=Cupriavidus sp. 2MCAB6 TaxID=3232981 RepID=UPI003F908F62
MSLLQNRAIRPPPLATRWSRKAILGHASDGRFRGFREHRASPDAKVLSGLVAGQSPAEFAVQNGVSENTVRKQVASLKFKMNGSRSVELVRLALMHR